MPPLSVLIWMPAAFGVLGALVATLFHNRGMASAAPPEALAREERRGWTGSVSGALALLGALAALGLAIAYIADYRAGGPHLQHVTDVVWIAALGIHYKLAVTGLNVFLVGLAALLFAAATLAANLRTWDRPRLFYFQFMLAESAVLGAFLAQDLALFVAFFDLMLIPFYFLIGTNWDPAHPRPGRVRATIKLVVYTLVGSLLMLAGAVAAGVLAGQHTGGHITFVLSTLQAQIAAGGLSTGSQEWIFPLFAAAFLVKMPAFPLHGWMPDGYRAMPIEVLMVFSGVLSKVGAYGFLAIVLPLFPRAAVHYQTLMLVIGLVSIVYGSVQAFSQNDARLVLGYSSVAQLGFITLGVFALNPQGAQGALLQMVNHGLVMGPILFIVALLAQRAGGSEDIREMGGIAFRAPVLASIALVVTLATLAMPGSSNFVGEFLILLGVFKAKLAIAIVAFSGVIMASVYALRLFIRALHNRVGERVRSREISLYDGAVLVPLLAVIVFFAVYPQLALHRSERSVASAVASAHADLSRAPAAPASAQAAAGESAGAQAGAGGPAEAAGAAAGTGEASEAEASAAEGEASEPSAAGAGAGTVEAE